MCVQTVLHVGNSAGFWHQQCLRCADCGAELSDRCFSAPTKHGGGFLCRQDYIRYVCEQYIALM